MFFGKGAASSKFSDILPLSQSEGRGADYVQPFALPHIKIFMITPLIYMLSTYFKVLPTSARF